MNITREVISDLLPLYLENSASEDTRRLVETFLEQDKEFAQLVSTRTDEVLNAEIDIPLTKEKELKVLERTKRLLKLRETAFFLAIFFSLSPLTAWHTSWGSGSLIRDFPLVSAALAVVAALMWILHFVLRRNLSVAGM
ncbi:hypothetical protein JYU10_00625 [bacterium AH-315-J04]|nr:hypothetical protein [bacterium AH-315-J04]